MGVPLLDLKAQWLTYKEEAKAAIDRVLESQAFILGDEVKAFERALSDYTGSRAVGVSSGTDALLLALWALDLHPGAEVVTTPFTFFATAGAIARMGLRPVFADIDPLTLNLDPKALLAAISHKTEAVIPVHLFGRICDLGDFYAAPSRPRVIEDAAQAIGASLGQKQAGQFGDLTALSFFPSKNLGGMGDGGAILCSDEALEQRLRRLRVHGAEKRYLHQELGGNFRLDALQAAVLAVKLKHLDRWSQARRRHAQLYNGLLEEKGLLSRGLIAAPPYDPGAVFNQYVIRAQDRDALKAALDAQGIGTAVYYPLCLHLQPCFAHLGYGPGDFPLAEAASREVLALPVYPELTEAQQAEVVNALAAFYRI